MKHRSIQSTKMMNCLTAAVKGFRAEFILHTKDVEAGCEKTASLQSLLPFCHFFIIMTTTSTVLLNTGCSTSCYQFVLCSCLKKGVFFVCVCFFLGFFGGGLFLLHHLQEKRGRGEVALTCTMSLTSGTKKPSCSFSVFNLSLKLEEDSICCVSTWVRRRWWRGGLPYLYASCWK